MIDPARRLHPSSLLARWLAIVPQMVGGGAAYAAAVDDWGRLLWFATLAGVAGLAFAILSWWRFTYRLAEDEVIIESGLLHRKRRVIPFERIQDVAIERPLLGRLMGTARLRIETGGAGSDEGLLDMVALSDAELLRTRLRRRAAPAAVEAAPAAEHPLFVLNFRRLLLSGLFDFSLLLLAAVFALLQNLVEFGIIDIKSWLTPERATAAAGLIDLRLSLVLLVLLLLVGTASGVFRTVLRDFGFALTRTGQGFRRRRGLVTLSETVIPIRRAQLAVIESGMVAGPLGWHRLSLQTLGADRRQGGLERVIPFGRMEEIVPVLQEAGFPPPPTGGRWRRAPRRTLAGRLILTLFLMTLVALGLILLAPQALFLAPVMLVVLLGVGLRWSRRKWRREGDTLFVTTGLLKQRCWIVPAARLQTVSRTEGPLQRRLRVATLIVDTAGASPIHEPLLLDADRREAKALACWLLRSRRAVRPLHSKVAR